jgi:serine/threonine protein phosphatase 1
MSLTYAIGDIHGSLDKLRTLVAACREHAGAQPARFVFLGDYIDRGPDSAGVIRFMMRLQDEMGAGVIALMGNHEALALESRHHTATLNNWLRNGGRATLESYGVRTIADLPAEHLNWLGSLSLRYDDGRRFFVHAGIDPEKPLDAQDSTDLLWIREPFLSDRRDHGRLIVHGHTPVEARSPDLRANRLNLDTGAVFGGPLTAAAFDDQEVLPFAVLSAP